jgi:hypothetical protein
LNLFLLKWHQLLKVILVTLAWASRC